MIRQCEDTFHRIKVNGKSYDVRSWECSCDFCGAVAHKTGDDPGQAHEKAWKEGFRPVSMGITRPMRWACATCVDKRVKGAKGSAKPVAAAANGG
jgi:hypothetical protein